MFVGSWLQRAASCSVIYPPESPYFLIYLIIVQLFWGIWTIFRKCVTVLKTSEDINNLHFSHVESKECYIIAINSLLFGYLSLCCN